MYQVFIGNQYHNETMCEREAHGWAKELSRDYRGKTGYVKMQGFPRVVASYLNGKSF